MSRCECDWESLTMGMSAGIVNFGGTLVAQGKLLRVNGHMQSPLNTEFADVGNAFYVGSPIQVNAIAWNKSSQASDELNLLLTSRPFVSIVLNGPVGVVELTPPVLLDAGDELRAYLPWALGPIQLSFYVKPNVTHL